MIKQILVGVSIAAVSLAGLTACNNDKPPGHNATAPRGVPDDEAGKGYGPGYGLPDLTKDVDQKSLKWRYYSDRQGFVIWITVTNHQKDPYDYDIYVSEFDNRGIRIDDAVLNVQYVKPGETTVVSAEAYPPDGAAATAVASMKFGHVDGEASTPGGSG